jgi:hypothetical protein
MTLIELYVAEVGKRLPLRGRGDIEAELRSTLEDMLEDRRQKAGRPIDEAMTLELLREYGPPDKVANTYHPHQYLIGPRLFPFFVKVLKIVLSVLVIVLVVTLGLELAREPAGPGLAQAAIKAVMGILGGAMQAFGNVALVFAILERVLPASEFKFDEEKKTWDPADLRKEAEPKELKLWEPIAAIVFTAAALIIFNGYPDVIGTVFVQDGRWISISALTEAFFRWLPYMNVLWALQIALNVVLLRQGRWQLATRLTSIVLDAAGIVIGYLLLIGPPIVNFSAEAMAATGLADPGTAAALNATLQQAVRLVIVIVMIVQGVDVVKEVVKLILRRHTTLV